LKLGYGGYIFTDSTKALSVIKTGEPSAIKYSPISAGPDTTAGPAS
jgi:hypothetical protein